MHLSITVILIGVGTSFAMNRLLIRWFARGEGLARRVEFHHGNNAPVPRLGGVTLIAALIAVEAFLSLAGGRAQAGARASPNILLGPLAMFTVGFVDDLRPLGARRKLILQILVALFICSLGVRFQVVRVPFTGTELDLGGWGVLLSVLWLLGMTNLVNFMDGADGLAGGVCAIVMVLLAYVGKGTGEVSLVALGMAAALVGFLCYNFPPARIYLGDGGAYFLGFQIAQLSLVSSHKGEVLVALAAPLFTLAVPILDMGLAISRRALRGLPVSRADRHHLHHRLLDLGLSRRKMVLAFYLMTLVSLVLGLAAFWSRGTWIPVLLGMGLVLATVAIRRLHFGAGPVEVTRLIGASLRMRPDVQYALCATQLLGLEGARRNSVEALWKDLVRTGQNMGFTSIRLVLGRQVRAWSQPIGCEARYSIRQVLCGGNSGTLELKAPHCLRDGSRRSCPRRRACQRPALRMRDNQMFEVLSELLAEGWIKALSRCGNGEHPANGS